MALKNPSFLILWFLPAIGMAQAVNYDFRKAQIRIAPDPVMERIDGEVRYEFFSREGTDSIILDAHGMEFYQVQLDGKPAGYSVTSKNLLVKGPVEGGTHHLQIAYRASPEQAVYFMGWKDSIQGNEQIWTQGQGKDSSHWVPVVDRMEEKVEFDITVLFEPGYQVISNGLLTGKFREGERNRWDFDMEKPMSSYLLAFAIGHFDALFWESDSGVSLEGYYPRGKTARARWTYRYTQELFNFLEKEIGIPYPWRDYKQVPVRDFLYAGMENTGATFFSDQYLVDSIGYNDVNYINVNAHELAHQWFGNLVTETDASQHWLHEGFATFYAYQAESHVLGADLVHWKLYDTARTLEQMDDKGSGESLLDPGAGSLTFYEKGAWALYLLREQVGEAAFRQGVGNFLQAYAYDNARVDDFLRLVEKASGASLEDFRKTWLEAVEFPLAPALEYLKRNSEPIREYLELLDAKRAGTPPGEAEIAAAWGRHTSPEYRSHLLRTFRGVLSPSFLERACQGGSLPVQKAFLETTQTLEDWMIPLIEGWLDAPSYDLREAALFRLWVAVPEGRGRYLDRVSGNGSLSHPRLQQFWWLLALITEGYAEKEVKAAYLERLRGTTAPSFPWEIRENAFSMLHEVGALGKNNLQDLMQATEHHSWQFRKFARALLDALMEEQPDPTFWSPLAASFPKERYSYLYQKIESL